MPRPSPNNKPQKFRQRDLERAIRAARSMGVPIGAVTVDPHTGKITITTGNPNDSNTQDEEHGNAAAKLDDWVARKNARQA